MSDELKDWDLDVTSKERLRAYIEAMEKWKRIPAQGIYTLEKVNYISPGVSEIHLCQVAGPHAFSFEVKEEALNWLMIGDRVQLDGDGFNRFNRP